VYSREQNVDADGNPRTYINDANTTNLYQTLTQLVSTDVANYIMIYRRYGPNANAGQGGQTPQNMGTTTQNTPTTQPPTTGATPARTTPAAPAAPAAQQPVTMNA